MRKGKKRNPMKEQNFSFEILLKIWENQFFPNIYI